jgi:hypothetical protein
MPGFRLALLLLSYCPCTGMSLRLCTLHVVTSSDQLNKLDLQGPNAQCQLLFDRFKSCSCLILQLTNIEHCMHAERQGSSST